MTALIEKLKNAARTRGGASAPGRLVEGGLLSQALVRAKAERDAVRNADVQKEIERVASEEQNAPLDAAEPHGEAQSPASPHGIGAGLAAGLLALAILAASIALWHFAPSADPHKNPATLKLEHNLKAK